MGAVEKRKRKKSFVFLCICLLMEMCNIFPLYALANLAYRWDKIRKNSHIFDLYVRVTVFGVPIIKVLDIIAFIGSICILVSKKPKEKREKILAICILALSIMEILGIRLMRQGIVNCIDMIWSKMIAYV